MPSVFDNLVNKVFETQNICLTPLTDKAEITKLIHRLHPIDPGIELIRLGPKSDGGYLIPNDLVGIEACFSPGVGAISGFEKDCADLGMQVFLADKSVQMPEVPHDKFHFLPKFIGATASDTFITIDDWVNVSLSQSESDLLLQIDIEGYEYESFLSMSNHLIKRFRIIVVEFHELDQLWSQPFFKVAARVFEKILQTHTCTHIHPNNCSGALVKQGLNIPQVMEFTFLRRDRVRGQQPSFAQSFPHPLDEPNTLDLPPRPLPSCWYRN